MSAFVAAIASTTVGAARFALGGDLMAAADLVLDPVGAAVARRLPFAMRPTIVSARHAHTAGAAGDVALARDALGEHPGDVVFGDQ